jgi:hypothetical protein
VTISATSRPIAKSRTVVWMSFELEIFSDWYGLVKKKSKDIAATTAATAPLTRVPTVAASTMTTTKTSTTLAAARLSRNETRMPETSNGPNAAIARPIARAASSGVLSARAIPGVYAVIRAGGGVLTRS